MRWCGVQGCVVAQVRFDEGRTGVFKLDVVMATLLLNLQAEGYKAKLEKVLARTDLGLSDAVEQIETLVTAGLVNVYGNFKEGKCSDTEI
jgi:hypothetical protein